MDGHFLPTFDAHVTFGSVSFSKKESANMKLFPKSLPSEFSVFSFSNLPTTMIFSYIFSEHSGLSCVIVYLFGGWNCLVASWRLCVTWNASN